jgi:hypothetical protein
MSKKLIAVASAAALALSALVAVPANANITVAYANEAGPVTPSATAAAATAGSGIVDVPANNVLEFTSTADRSSLIEVTVTTVAKDVVTVAATGAIKIVDDKVDAADEAYDSTAGASAYTVTATTTSVVFYVYTTSTTAGSLTISKGGNTQVVYFKGIAGAAYNIAVTAPTFVAAGLSPTTDNVTVAVSDVFGNNVAAEAGVVTLAVLGGGASLDDLTPDYSSTTLTYGSLLTAASAGTFALTAKITVAPEDVDGLAEAKDTFFATINSASAADTITSLTAQLATLQAAFVALEIIKDRKVSKLKYNRLARKWNAAFPSNKVWVKP